MSDFAPKATELLRRHDCDETQGLSKGHCRKKSPHRLLIAAAGHERSGPERSHAMLEQPTQQLSISCRNEESTAGMPGRVDDQRLQFLGRFAHGVAAKSDPARIADNLAVPFDNCGDLPGNRSIQLKPARKAVCFVTDLLTPRDIVRSREPYPVAVCCIHRDCVPDRQEGLANIESGFRIEREAIVGASAIV
jgi:hypothetical protein